MSEYRQKSWESIVCKQAGLGAFDLLLDHLGSRQRSAGLNNHQHPKDVAIHHYFTAYLAPS